MTRSSRQGIHPGIDVSKRTLDVCILREDAPRSESFVVTNDQEGMDELLSRLEGMSVEPAVVEATGRYERPATTTLATRAGSPWRSSIPARPETSPKP